MYSIKTAPGLRAGPLKCPCCGAPSERRVLVDLRANSVTGPLGTIQLGQQGAQIADALARASRPVPIEKLVRAIWGYEAERIGNPEETLHTYVSRARRALGTIGLTIRHQRFQGYSLFETAAKQAL